jgi:hypothetical protein
MPADVARVELIFESNGYGWTENYFITDATGTLAIATARSLVLVEKRRNILAKPAAITFRSISDTGGQRAGNTFPVPPSAGLGAYASGDKEATSLLFKRLNGTGKQHSSVFVRGVPDYIVANGGIYTPDAEFIGDLQQYQTELVTAPWGWLGENVAQSKSSQIVNVAADLNKCVVFTVADNALPFPSPKPHLAFRVSGIVGAGNLNNQWVGVVTSGTTIRTVKPVPFFAPVAATGKLSFRILQLITIVNSNVQRVVTRHAGRPLYHSPGRAKAQARG